MKPWKLKKTGNSEFDSLEAAVAKLTANGLHDRGSILSMPTSRKWSTPLMYSEKECILVFHIPDACHPPTLLDLITLITGDLVKFSHDKDPNYANFFTFLLVSQALKYIPQHFVSKH
jgi:hypothetical protein